VTAPSRPQDRSFRLEEATIAELHAAIRSGRTTCVAVDQRYLERVRANSGVASLLVTGDGAPVPAVVGQCAGRHPSDFPWTR
jgi:Asp-tRNA(Asn)/Glu-tRNA(Gln) amidotransferase A subunit family amidase